MASSRIARANTECHSDQLHDPTAESTSYLLEAERILGYTFHNQKLLQEALTHSSFSTGTISYQRLEFVGDAALNLAIANCLYLLHSDLGPGRLSSLRSANVSTEKLARAAVRHGLYPLVRCNSPELDRQVQEFTEAISQEPEEDQIHGGSSTKAPKVLADVVEAIAAAIYKDCNSNLDTMWKVVGRLLEPLITAETFGEQPVKTLYELCQKSGKKVKFRPSQKEQTIFVECLLDGVLVGYGSSKAKKIAKLNAARVALEKLHGEMSSLLIKSQRNEDEEEAKQKLNEFCMKRHWPNPVYKLEEEKGLAHSRTFICSVHIETTNDNFIALGEYRSRVKDAEKSAALMMLSIVLKTAASLNEASDEKKAKNKLDNFCMQRHWPLPEYTLEKENHQSRSRRFICSVHVQAGDDNIVAMGEYRHRIKDAERSAALNMLKRNIISKGLRNN